jgi:hypothetical protein
VLEQGAAAQQTDNSSWLYATTTALAAGQSAVIEATAVDRPGNTAIKTLVTLGISEK